MSLALRIVFAVLLIAALCSSAVFASLDDNSRLGSPELAAFINKRGFLNWQKKWTRLEPSIRFIKRGGHPALYEDDAFF